MNITVNIQAPELAGAILALAKALGSKAVSIETITETKDLGNPIQQPYQVPAQQQAPTAAAPVQEVHPQQGVPTTPTYQEQPPVQQQAPQQPQPVPTSAPSYSMDQLAVAATQLMDAGKRENLLQLLAKFGVQDLTALPKEQYGAFATSLRELGAKI